MENKVKDMPTAKEFLKTYKVMPDEFYCSGMCLSQEKVENIMIRFSDLKCQPLLERANELVKTNDFYLDTITGLNKLIYKKTTGISGVTRSSR